jgi:hypothetical protein
MAPKKRVSKKTSLVAENNTTELPVENHEFSNDLDKKEKLSENEKTEEETNKEFTHVVIRLPISAEHVENILLHDDMCNPFEYNPRLTEPTAYSPVNYFMSNNDAFAGNGNETIEKKKKQPLQSSQSMQPLQSIQKGQSIRIQPDNGVDIKSDIKNEVKSDKHKSHVCFWCCHSVDHNQFGMPIRYDPIHNSFTFFGIFCSLECSSAYNFSVHMGSDRAWEVQSWIQIMARNYGIQSIIRPAPSRYTLQMFDGPLTIEEFRKAHKGMSKSVMVNIPPLVNMKPQIETINTSFFTTDSSKDSQETVKKVALRRKASVTDNGKTLESKMNLSYTSMDTLDTLDTTGPLNPTDIQGATDGIFTNNVGKKGKIDLFCT